MGLLVWIKKWLVNNGPLLVGVTIIGFMLATPYVIELIRKAERDQEKKCYKELTYIISKSSKIQADLIQETIIAERRSFGGSRYCWVLELVTASEIPEGSKHE
jgi:hypothetical protein